MTDLGIRDVLMKALLDSAKEPDGLLHCSGLAHCEYSQLQQAMGHVNPAELDIIDLIVMMTGTLWHKFIQDSADEYILLPEKNLSSYMPKGWAGSIDGVWLKKDPGVKLVQLIDIKTMAGSGMRFIKGVKPEHKWQVSAYYWAIWNLMKFDPWEGGEKLTLSPNCTIFYMPVSRDKEYKAEPIEVEFIPYSREETMDRMNERSIRLQTYRDTGVNTGKMMPLTINTKRASGGYKNIYMGPNWWVNYCPALDCPCSVQKNRKVGTLDPGGNITSTVPDMTAEEIGELLNA